VKGVLWNKPRQVLLVCAGLDLLGLVGLAALVDRIGQSNLLGNPIRLLLFGLVYILWSWLFGSYTLLRWPRLLVQQVVVRLAMSAVATLMTTILIAWLLNLPETFTLVHRRTQLSLLVGISFWALAVRLLLRQLIRQRQRLIPTLLERTEQQQQRLLPAHLPEEAITLAEIPWADSLSVQRQLKRTADIAVSVLLLFVTLPLMLLAALLIWLEDHGPVFFVQERSGLMGRTFRLYKLRTMLQADPQAAPSWTVRGDDRITRIGWFLRRVRLDELPQLLNVLRGDMSLIGPRPERPELEHALEESIPHYRKRHWMPPGLSGWAQVCAPYAASVEEAEIKLSYDLYYLRHWGIAIDLLILLKTIKTVLKAGGR
jgi:lipopolysaccharide/colanic/teichoic acid biosynthesis glycosyltransferase